MYYTSETSIVDWNETIEILLNLDWNQTTNLFKT